MGLFKKGKRPDSTPNSNVDSTYGSEPTISIPDTTPSFTGSDTPSNITKDSNLSNNDTRGRQSRQSRNSDESDDEQVVTTTTTTTTTTTSSRNRREHHGRNAGNSIELPAANEKPIDKIIDKAMDKPTERPVMQSRISDPARQRTPVQESNPPRRESPPIPTRSNNRSSFHRDNSPPAQEGLIPTSSLNFSRPVSRPGGSSFENTHQEAQRQGTLAGFKQAYAGIHGAGEVLRSTVNSSVDRHIPLSATHDGSHRFGYADASTIENHNRVLNAGREEIEGGKLRHLHREEKAFQRRPVGGGNPNSSSSDYNYGPGSNDRPVAPTAAPLQPVTGTGKPSTGSRLTGILRNKIVGPSTGGVADNEYTRPSYNTESGSQVHVNGRQVGGSGGSYGPGPGGERYDGYDNGKRLHVINK